MTIKSLLFLLLLPFFFFSIQLGSAVFQLYKSIYSKASLKSASVLKCFSNNLMGPVVFTVSLIFFLYFRNSNKSSLYSSLLSCEFIKSSISLFDVSFFNSVFTIFLSLVVFFPIWIFPIWIFPIWVFFLRKINNVIFFYIFKNKIIYSSIRMSCSAYITSSYQFLYP